MSVDDLAGMISVDDPRRPVFRRAIVSALWAAAVFSVGTGPVKQIKPVYNHAPWLNDPFDAAISFAMFFVPLVAVFCLARLTLCRRSEPIPSLRVFDLLRGCRVMLAAIAVTLLSEWIAIAVGANQEQWDAVTWLQVALLVMMTGLVAKATIDLGRASGTAEHQPTGKQPVSDWLTDAVLIAERLTARLGPLKPPARRGLDWVDQRLIHVTRRRPLRAAAILCAVFGAAVGINQGAREGYDLPSTLTIILLGSCCTFGLVAGAGSYLGIVRSETRLVATKRRLVGAFVLTCAAVLVPFALRDSLWWIVGSSSTKAGLPQLGALLGIFSLLFFVVAVAVDLPSWIDTAHPKPPMD